MTILGYGAFFHTSPVMNSVYTIVSGGPPYQVGPYAGPGRGVFLRAEGFPKRRCQFESVAAERRIRRGRPKGVPLRAKGFPKRRC